MTQRTRAHLASVGVPYDYINIERDEAAADWVKGQNGGRERKPTVVVGDQVLSEPTHEELDGALARAGR